MSDPDLPALVTKAQKGDAKAFEIIVRGTVRLVYAQIVASVRDRQKAEDLTQETYLAAWKAIGTVKSPGGFTSWLLTLARNTMLDAVKFEGRKKRQPAKVASGEAAQEAADPAPPPPEELERREARGRAMRMLEELPEDYRRPLMMRYLAGADYGTIKRELQLTDGALRGQLSRGMAMLRERMTRQER